LGPRPSPHLLLTGALGASILGVHVSPQSPTWLISLGVSALAVLLLHGSQSNHVLLEMALIAAFLLTAPMAVWSSWARLAGRVESEARYAWARQLLVALRAIVCVLYTVTAFAKLNDDFFDPAVSCSVHLATGFLGHLMPRSPHLLSLLPYSGVAFEAGFPLVFLAALRHADGTATAASTRSSRLALRACAVLGSVFHIVIAMPPPPMSVYPFSMLMAPLYVCLLPEELSAAARAALRAQRHVRAAAVGAMLSAVLAAAAYARREERRFEYPPYFSWEVGLLWVVGTFTALIGVALFTPLPPARPSGVASANGGGSGLTRREWARALAPSIFIAAVGCAPYLGVRTHPAFAMFSNLRVEGGSSNHWLVHRAGGLLAGVGPSSGAEFGPDRAIEILQTDLPALRHLQVNLSPLLPPGTLEALRRVGALPEFHISPPSWSLPPTEGFRPFAVPVVEVRRRIAAAVARETDFYLRYRELDDQGGRAKEREYRRRRGQRTRTSDPTLEEPLSFLRASLHRYRTFDTNYSPCRH
jgi:hypothetical protein